MAAESSNVNLCRLSMAVQSRGAGRLSRHRPDQHQRRQNRRAIYKGDHAPDQARERIQPTFPIYHPNSWKSHHFPTAKGTVSPMQPSDGMILVIGPRLEGHSVIFLAIQTHLSCRFLLAVDSLGLRRSGSSSQIINQAQDFPEQVPRHRHLSQLERNVAAMSDNLGPVFTSLSRNVVIDQCSTSFGKASVLMKLPRL